MTPFAEADIRQGSDDQARRVCQSVREQLRGAGHAGLCLGDIHCEFQEGVLRLTGRVHSYYLKQIAQTVARRVGGVCRVDNRLVVD